ncbi:MAG: D-glycero-beta-D-manno-heptose 1-phosphate adenylyltransferase [Chitinophagaceae bacterium]|nr:MAG: D-glycero-beta-D-manno-heptose 1-phosphate adenylyltransferase [Chitinophagaceae bacterium]
MKAPLSYRNKILTPVELQRRVAQWRLLGKTIAFTNGCFDIIHAGHISSLSAAAAEADFLVVGVNSDASVKRLKGESRPVNDQDRRSAVLASLLMIDGVVVFDEDTPRELIASFLPEVLVKGGDYKVEDIAGAAEVQAAGGRVVINPILKGFSTTGIIEKLRH